MRLLYAVAQQVGNGVRVEVVVSFAPTREYMGAPVWLGNFEPSRLPLVSNGRRGDGLGCREHAGCRHGGNNYRRRNNWRGIPKHIARRQARKLKAVLREREQPAGFTDVQSVVFSERLFS